jgi:hypothetical protein
MTCLGRVVVAAGFVMAGIVSLDVRAEQATPKQSQPAAPPPAPAAGVLAMTAPPPTSERFAGSWDYNAAESVNAANGRPEQSPRGARTVGSGARGGTPTRGGGTGGTGGGAGTGGAGTGGGATGGGTGGAGGTGPVGGGTGGGGFGGGGMAPMRGGEFGLTPMAQEEMRALVRDLMEVPEMLRIKVTEDAVTFTDDLERERTYPIDGKKRKYRLGGASFEAKLYWSGAQLKKDIEGPYGFRMSETYFLSEDSSRLFIIIRVGDQTKKPPPPVAGANRVYDRLAANASWRSPGF